LGLVCFCVLSYIPSIRIHLYMHIFFAPDACGRASPPPPSPSSSPLFFDETRSLFGLFALPAPVFLCVSVLRCYVPPPRSFLGVSLYCYHVLCVRPVAASLVCSSPRASWFLWYVRRAGPLLLPLQYRTRLHTHTSPIPSSARSSSGAAASCVLHRLARRVSPVAASAVPHPSLARAHAGAPRLCRVLRVCRVPRVFLPVRVPVSLAWPALLLCSRPRCYCSPRALHPYAGEGWPTRAEAHLLCSHLCSCFCDLAVLPVPCPCASPPLLALRLAPLSCALRLVSSPPPLSPVALGALCPPRYMPPFAHLSLGAAAAAALLLRHALVGAARLLRDLLRRAAARWRSRRRRLLAHCAFRLLRRLELLLPLLLRC
jgi:hypothetical protein